MKQPEVDPGVLSRARGYLLGQCVGDTLGQQVEFRTLDSILAEYPDEGSQANGSLMRVSPWRIHGSRFEADEVAEWAQRDSRLTHPNVVWQKAVAIYVTTIAESIRTGISARKLCEHALKRAETELYFEPSIEEALKNAADGLPERFSPQTGWAMIDFCNAFYHLVNTSDPEKAIVETVSNGGDTDTNGAICGALLGAVYGIESIPVRWRDTVLTCKPSRNNPDCVHLRAEYFWPVDVLSLAEELLTV